MTKLEQRRRNTNRLAVQSLESRQLLAADGFSPIDGVGNNVGNPAWGAAGEQFLRLSPAAYEDGIGTPARRDGVNAREISDLISAQDSSI